MKSTRWIWTFCIIIMFFMFSPALAANLPEFSADQITTITHDGQSNTVYSRIYVGTRKFREELMQKGPHRMIMVMREDKHVIYQLDPENKTALEMPFKSSPLTIVNDPRTHFVKMGPERVDGTACNKFEMTVDGKPGGFLWKSIRTGNPVLFRTTDGEIEMRYKHYAPGHQPDTLFEVPSDYRIMNMGGFAHSMGRSLERSLGNMMPTLP